jgi:aldose 1-epimerase
MGNETQVARSDPQILELRDEASGASARILAGLGFNCFSFRPGTAAGNHDVLWAAQGFETGTQRPSGSGIPILFPFAGRLRGKCLAFRGREYALDSDDGFGNAIHGFVYTRPWRVTEQSKNRAAGSFQASRDDPGLSARWPGDFAIEAAWTLTAATLACEIEIANLGDDALPWALGLHPYFRNSLDASRGGVSITVPAGAYWELGADKLPTGRRLPVDARRDLRRGRRVTEVSLDDVLSELKTQSGRFAAWLDDAAARRRVRIECGEPFDHCVVYTPPHGEAICIEPYSAVPGALSMVDPPPEAGVRLLQPGQRRRARMEIRVEDVS